MEAIGGLRKGVCDSWKQVHGTVASNRLYGKGGLHSIAWYSGCFRIPIALGQAVLWLVLRKVDLFDGSFYVFTGLSF